MFGMQSMKVLRLIEALPLAIRGETSSNCGGLKDGTPGCLASSALIESGECQNRT